MLQFALACAAMLMGTNVPPLGHLQTFDDIPASTCPWPQGCRASQVSTEQTWTVYGPNLDFPTAVHEACHRVQIYRNAWIHIEGVTYGPASEAECIALELRTQECIDRIFTPTP